MARTAVLGFPRIGAERELKTALEDHWAGPSSRRRAGGGRARRCARRTCAPASTPASTCCRSATSRSTTTSSTPPSWSGSSAPRHRGGRRRFAACRGADGVAPARADEVVRHELPLPRAGAARRDSASGCAPGKWLAHLPRRASSASPRARSCSARSRCCCWPRARDDPLALLPALTDGLRRAAARARRGRRDARCSSTSRASRSTATDAELDAFAAAYAALVDGARPAICLATYFAALPAPALDARRGAAARRSCTSTSCARRSSSTPCSPRCRPARGCRPASSTGATSGRPTSTARSTCSTARPPRSAASG